jgi:hypothetical protein
MAQDKHVHGDEVAKHDSREKVSRAIEWDGITLTI